MILIKHGARDKGKVGVGSQAAPKAPPGEAEDGSVEDPRPPDGLEMSRPASQGYYRAELNTRAGRDRSKIPGPNGGASPSTPFGAPEAVQGAKGAKRSGGGSIELLGSQGFEEITRIWSRTWWS
jgi:hypothetical protein